MPIPTEEKWMSIANQYYRLWNLPNCVGSIDGKHIRIQKVPNTGSTNFNYKTYHSIVLMACSDADGNFIMIETGFAGRNSDSGIFRASRMGRWLERDGLNLPNPRPLPNDPNEINFPFYFVADEAFPLKKNLMRPNPRRTLTNKKRIFNYRLSRGRKTVECSFGMMSQKFQVLMSPIRCTNEITINNIIRSVCILHNFIRKREGRQYIPSIDFDVNNPEYFQVPNEFIRDNQDQNELPRTQTARDLREYLSSYFVKPYASLPWQWNNCV
ncbi:protein ANTAGONIST OF LIKE HETEROCHROMATIN PROTEIN 1-like [Aphis craccivora]|uniref:Protein ANTAGONIST OF LIKE HETEROCHROMATIN PROTEIN 1-like n=1 Tax=Aphis craccivora TaxID=307492 RepID=A0A6G0VSI8_APHCR|nr:protein ANTAGONIST OF LIKE HETEROCHROMATIN PROTEIN 1-like [Aphis craccivora]